MGQDSRVIDAWLKALPGAGDLLFWPPPAALYTVADLYDGFSPDDPDSWREAWDTRVFDWTLGSDGKARELGEVETVATRLHDAAMDRLVRDFIDPANGRTIGFMGGHDVPRTDAAYARVARIARELRRRAFKIVTGGGPGLMEAANLGAFLAPFTDEAFDGAIKSLRAEPDYGSSPDKAVAQIQKTGWIRSAAEVRERLLGGWAREAKPGGESLGIPTWYYGAEPPNMFASASGKYFMNSVREDGLVSVANGGLVFGKGAAGTVQEVFQNASYNYYRGKDEDGNYVDPTPMVFLGMDFWNPGPAADAAADAPLDPRRKPVFPLVQKLSNDAVAGFSQSLMLTSDPDAVVEFLCSRNADRVGPARRADMRLSCVNALATRQREG
jgi:hypothetical protein